MGGVVKTISKIINPAYAINSKYDPLLADLNGDNKVKNTATGPTTAELQAQREADAAAARAEEKKLADQAKAKAEETMRSETLRKRQASTLATGALGLESLASVTSKGLRTTLG